MAPKDSPEPARPAARRCSALSCARSGIRGDATPRSDLGGCERQFFAIQVEATAIDALTMEDVVEAAEQLVWARTLSDLFGPADLDLPDAA